ncbi:MAG: NF038129 family PEP-CTERM protein [Candidatus Competibacteraceae bacterium]|nr:NF038129 family PEP-CTERM protein [Candidatus Competibacteraceae bacterium]
MIFTPPHCNKNVANFGRCSVFAAALAAFLWAGPTPAHATTLQFSLDTTPLAGTAASLAFDFISGDDILGNNAVVVSNFYTTGTLGKNSASGGVTGTLIPGPVTLTDTEFFNEFLQELTFLDNTVSFTLNLTEHFASGSRFPDSFAFFLLDDQLSPLFATTDPTGALFAVDIDGTPGGTRYLFNYAGASTPVTWTLESVAVPLPSTALLFGAGLLGWVAGRRRR